jgi:ubiquinone/menaquinone biosynthesis C-methylase UbiE
MVTADHASWGFTSSTGLGFTEASIVDAHFAACRPTYLDLLNRAGIRRGWRVLDAGCGSGAFLPRLSELVGPDGAVTAIDLAEENAALAATQPTVCPLRTDQGNLMALPYPAASFDAAWCANAVQYLDDDELARALAELRRVVRPGGIIAVKDLDASLVTVRPGDPFLFPDFFRQAAATPGYARQLLRTRDLHRWLRAAGLVAVRQWTVLSEHFAPLTPEEWSFYGPSCATVARQALALGVPGEWQPFLTPGGQGHPLADPDGYLSEGNVLAVGVVPPG